MAITRRACRAVAGLGLVFGMAACSSGGSGGGTASSSSAGTASSGASADAAGINVAGAQAIVDKYLDPPQSLGLPPLSKKPPTGKYLITLETPQAVSTEKDEAIAQAAALLGWKYQRIPIGTEANGAQSAFELALQRNPSAVHFSGTPASQIEAQLKMAQQQGVIAISDSTTDTAAPPVISTSLDSTAQVEQWGEMTGAYVVAQSKAPTTIAVFTISAYPILQVYTSSFQATVMKYCPACHVNVVAQTVTDLGTITPQSVVSTVERSPQTKWVMFSFGDLSLGVPAALQAAGLTQQVKIGGETPSAANLQALRNGTEAVWAGFATSILGWRVVDMLARQSVGDSLAPANSALLPTQLLTPGNIGQAKFDSGGYYVGVTDYQAQFEKLWHV
ncbi:MAG: substrate-binding domain-containing protein [Trebonia sp.]|jgi:ribose transport system substrate-binding protein